MDHVMASHPANYIQSFEYTPGTGPKRVTLIRPQLGDATPLKAQRNKKHLGADAPKPAKKPRKPRAPTEKSLAKARAKEERAVQRTLKRDKTYDAKKAAIILAMQACKKGCDVQWGAKKDKLDDWYNGIKPIGPKRVMSEATKKLLADICEAKKTGTYVKPTAEEKKARAKEQAKAR